MQTLQEVMQALIQKDITVEQAKDLLTGMRLVPPPQPTVDELWARSSGYADDPPTGPNDPFWLENAYNLGAITNAQRFELANVML